jgi:hypothetical protein
LTPLQTEIVAALRSTSWAGVHPAVTALAQAGAPQWRRDHCDDVDARNATRCVYGSGHHVAALVGDSVAVSWLPGLLRALPGWRIHVLTYNACPFGELDTYAPATATRAKLYAACTRHHTWVQAQLRALHPAMIIASDGWDAYRNGRIAYVSQGPVAVWQSAAEESLGAFRAITSHVVVLAPNPRLPRPQPCESHAVMPGHCSLAPSSGRILTMAAESQAAATTDVRYVDTTGWFCVEDDCPAVIDRIPVDWDGEHLTAAYSRFLAPQLRAALLPRAAPLPSKSSTP